MSSATAPSQQAVSPKNITEQVTAVLEGLHALKPSTKAERGAVDVKKEGMLSHNPGERELREELVNAIVALKVAHNAPRPKTSEEGFIDKIAKQQDQLTQAGRIVAGIKWDLGNTIVRQHLAPNASSMSDGKFPMDNPLLSKEADEARGIVQKIADFIEEQVQKRLDRDLGRG